MPPTETVGIKIQDKNTSELEIAIGGGEILRSSYRPSPRKENLRSALDSVISRDSPYKASAAPLQDSTSKVANLNHTANVNDNHSHLFSEAKMRDMTSGGMAVAGINASANGRL